MSKIILTPECTYSSLYFNWERGGCCEVRLSCGTVPLNDLNSAASQVDGQGVSKQHANASKQTRSDKGVGHEKILGIVRDQSKVECSAWRVPWSVGSHPHKAKLGTISKPVQC